MGKAVSNLFGLSKGDNTELNQSAQASMGMYNDLSKTYNAQNDNNLAFGNQLAQGALGKGPSIADAQMKQAQDSSLAQQMAAARANRAINPALAFRATQQAGGQQGAQIAQQAGIARLQEQQANQGQYQNYLSGLQGQRAQALGLNTQATSAQAANSQAAANSENAFTGGLIGAAASGLASYASMGTKTPVKVAHGAIIDGPEVVPGDSTANDLVDAKLSGGEMVVPKSIVDQGHKAVSSFAKHLIERQAAAKTKDAQTAAGFAKVAQAHQNYQTKKASLEAQYGKGK